MNEPVRACTAKFVIGKGGLERGEEIVFLRTVVPGSTDRSYGIQVARHLARQGNLYRGVLGVVGFQFDPAAKPSERRPGFDFDLYRNPRQKQAAYQLTNARADT